MKKIASPTSFLIAALLIFQILGCTSVSQSNTVAETPTGKPHTSTPTTIPPTVTPKPPAKTPSPTKTPLPSPMIIFTPEADRTYLSMFDYPDQVSDGILLLSVEKFNDGCHKPGYPIAFIFKFKNLTDEPIRVQSEFTISINRDGATGNISPFITSKDGSTVYSMYDGMIIDAFWGPADIYTVIPAKQEIEEVLVYRFPERIFTDPESFDTELTSPGQYFLRFIYSNNNREADVWNGIISSNRVDVCISYSTFLP